MIMHGKNICLDPILVFSHTLSCTYQLVLYETFYILHSTVETYTFGAEFEVIKKGIESLHVIQYKLHMMGLTLDGGTHIYGDHKFVMNNGS